ncbi:MAG: hypothetical protein Kow0037_02310 [Calditrichia bacterium]
MRYFFIFLLLISWVIAGIAADSVDVVFRYNISGVSSVTVPGEFNGWNNTADPMVYQGGDLWTKTIRLAVGGNPNPPSQGIPGAWQYKFYYPGASPWPNDPLNHHVNPNDNNNSYIYVKDPTIYHFLPNQRTGIVQTNLPTISAYIFPKVGSVVDTAALSLTIDGTTYNNIGQFYNFNTQQLVFVPPAPLPDGGHLVILDAGTNADTVNFVTSTQSAPVKPLPPYAKHGVTLPSAISNDSTTFCLMVSGTNNVLLRVAPAGQPVASATPMLMRKDPNSDYWWINVDLPAGTYEYLYQTDSGQLIYDPWGRWNGEYGSRFTIGPAGLTADDYVWKVNNFQRPPLNKLVIYELHVGEFAGGYYGLGAGEAGFSHLATMMDYFDSLGVNALELMPINDYGVVGKSGHSWGYDINSYFALEPAYGTPYEFKALVDSAHAHGISIIVDVVFNHMNDTGPLWAMQPDYSLNPYFKPISQLNFNEDGLAFFRDIDHWAPETQELIYNVLKMWIDEYRVDGFRYDYTQGIGWDVNNPNVGILGWANRIDQEYNGEIYQIAEHLPESPALIYHSGITSGWHDSYHDEIFDEARFQNTPLVNFENLIMGLGAYPGNDWPATPGVYQSRTEPVNANITHDEQSLIFEMITWQGVSLNDAIKRDKLYATFMFTSLGIPMLWEGQEFSEPRGWHNDNEKLSYRPVDWQLLNTVRGKEHFNYYRALIQQRLHNPALYEGTMHTLYRYENEKVQVWGFDHPTLNHKVMAIANLSNQDRTVTNVPWLDTGDWYNIWDQSVFVVNSTPVASITIPAYTALVYSNVLNSVLDIDDEPQTQLPRQFKVYQNYPNPFNPETRVRFTLPKSANVTAIVYDVLGRKIKTLAGRHYAAGEHQLSWAGVDEAGNPVGSGIYLLRVTAGENQSTIRMLLMK